MGEGSTAFALVPGRLINKRSFVQRGGSEQETVDQSFLNRFQKSSLQVLFLALVPWLLFALGLAARAASIDPKKETLQMNHANGRTQMIVVQESLNQVVIFRKDQPSNRTVIPVGEKPHEIEVTEDGETAYVTNFGLLEANHKVGNPGTTVSVIDVSKKRERTRFALPDTARAPHGLKLRPGHPNELFTNTEEGVEEMVVFDTTNGSVLRTFPLPSGVHNFIFSPDGSNCYAFTTTDRVLRLSATDGRIIAERRVPQVRGLSWTSDHSQLVVGGRGQVLVLNPETLSTTRTFADLPVGQTFYPSSSPDGRAFYAPAVLDGALIVIDGSSGRVRQRITMSSPLQVLFDGNQAWVSNVKVPTSMLKPGEKERLGGLVRLDTLTGQIEEIKGTEDANGIALAGR